MLVKSILASFVILIASMGHANSPLTPEVQKKFIEICNDPKKEAECRTIKYDLAKASQVEAKMLLVMSYVQFKSYYLENKKYPTSFAQLKELNDPDAPMKYILTLQSDCSSGPQTTSLDIVKKLGKVSEKNKAKILKYLATAHSGKKCDLSKNFVILAAGIVDLEGGNIDAWAISENKEIVNFKNGLPSK